jgi:hypothetical protein
MIGASKQYQGPMALPKNTPANYEKQMTGNQVKKTN